MIAMKIYVEETNTKTHLTTKGIMDEHRYIELYGPELLIFLLVHETDGEALGQNLYLYARLMQK